MTLLSDIKYIIDQYRTFKVAKTMNISRISTGILQLDSILKGGLIRDKSYLIKGGPGTGKSTFGYHFLEQGNREGETTMLISLRESETNIRTHSAVQGIDLSDTIILDLSPGKQEMKHTQNYSVFSPHEVEAEPMIQSVIKAVDEHQPSRVMLDSLTMVKYLFGNPFQYKNMALSLIHRICSSGSTLFMVAETHQTNTEEEAEFWVDGVIEVNSGPAWRRMRVQKFRGSDFQPGDHAIKITERGIAVYPRLQPGSYEREFQNRPLSTGIDKLDEMLGGGIEQGTITMITGPSGVGKTNLGIQFMKEASRRGERSVMYTFEEARDVIVNRSRLIGVPIESMIEKGQLEIKTIEPFSFSPDEFAIMVRSDIEENGTRSVMIDSVGGYSLTVREERALERLHALRTYLGNVGVTAIFVNETQSITGEFVTTNMNASYLADNIIYLRYLELNGELKKSIGILKKRLSNFEKSIREFNITGEGIKLGEPLKNLRGILSGTPLDMNPNR